MSSQELPRGAATRCDVCRIAGIVRGESIGNVSLNPITNRRKFGGLIAGFLLARPLVVGGQSAARVYRLGILRRGRFAPDDAYSVPVLLGDLGYVEGRNLVIERRSADDKSESLPGLARELVDLRVDAFRGRYCCGRMR